MILTELTTIPAASLPLVALKQHLKIGTGFAPGDEQDELLEAYLRAAIAALEARTGLALIARDFLWEVTGWRHFDRQAMPIGPVASVTELRIVDATGAAQIVDSGRYHLTRDRQAPALVAVGVALPPIPRHSVAEIRFAAGFGTDWSEVPPDLARACLLMAAEFYENRLGTGETGLPRAVAMLVEPFRRIRLGLA